MVWNFKMERNLYKRTCGEIVIWWCLLICIFIKSPCVCSDSDEESVSIYPKGDIYVTHGQDLELLCTAGGNSTSRDLIFTKSRETQETQIVNDTAIRLFKKKPPEHKAQPYFCKNIKTKRNQVVTVYVGSPPADVKDFACISKNIDYLNCSWTTPDLIIFTNYTLAYITNGNKVMPCAASSVEKSLTRYCIFNATSTPSYRQQFETYRFYLESRNEFGNNTQIFDIDHFSIVKPDPPLFLNAVGTGPHSVMLQWSLSNNIVDFLTGGVEHKIEYQIAKIDNTSHFRQVNTTGLPVCNKTYRFNLTGLEYAHMQYGVRVYIKPVKAKSDKFWSDFKKLVFYTSSEKPSRPPETIAGAFRQNVFQTYRVINIYWRQLEEYEEAGANFSYKVIVRHDSKHNTYEPEKDRSMGFLTLNNATLGDMHVSVFSSNEIGWSDNSSYVYIPSAAATYHDVKSFSKLAYENGTYELSWSWDGRGEIDNYTLFWCQHNMTDTCNGRINFTVLSPKLNKYVIDLPKDYRYQFAISANRGVTSSGMVWAKCHISKDEIAMFRFPIVFADHDAPGKSFVKLKWSMDCILKEGIILGYNISYCPVIKTSSICDKTDRNLSKYISDPKQMYTTIENLEPYKTYQFTMILHTSLGAKTIDNSTVRITTLEDAPSSPQNVAISDVGNVSLSMSWDRPEHINGHISKIIYKIYNYDEEINVVKYHQENHDNVTRIKWRLEGLHGFTNYSLSVQACNEGINACSERTTAITFRNCIGAPSKLEAAQFTSDTNLLTWKPPKVYGGTVDQYQVKIVRDERPPEIVNTTDLFYPLAQCQEGAKVEKYQVRAVNFDTDLHHGAASDSSNVSLPTRSKEDDEMFIYSGDWSDESRVLCGGKSSWFLVFIIIGVLAMIGTGLGILKLYKKIRKMRDIKPEFPKGLLPEKDMNIYPSIYPSEKDEKPTSDEMLLLPNSKNTSISTEVKQKDGTNCSSSDHTDSTALSDVSQGPVDRQNSTSDDDSHSSLHLQIEPIRTSEAIDEGETSNSNSDSSKENSPYFSDPTFKKNKVTGYVQPLSNSLNGGYIQSPPVPFKNNQQQIAVSQPGSSSYVMAGLPASAFPHSMPPAAMNPPPAPSGYVRAEDAMPRSAMNFPILGPSPTKIFGSESLPTMPNLPPSAKLDADSSYIQLQSLDALPSQKLNKRDLVTKPASSGYISPEDAVLNKHFKNIMSGDQIAEESAILDPAMSPDAYCRFSWSTDPANDNLNSLLGNSSAINNSKN